MQTARLEQWAIILTGNDFMAPELRSRALCGKVYNHPRIEDGKFVNTSSITGVRGENVLTRNTEYELGEVDPAYEAAFPNARQRLLKDIVSSS